MKRVIKVKYQDGEIGLAEAIRRLVEFCSMTRGEALNFLDMED